MKITNEDKEKLLSKKYKITNEDHDVFFLCPETLQFKDVLTGEEIKMFLEKVYSAYSLNSPLSTKSAQQPTIFYEARFVANLISRINDRNYVLSTKIISKNPNILKYLPDPLKSSYYLAILRAKLNKTGKFLIQFIDNPTYWYKLFSSQFEPRSVLLFKDSKNYNALLTIALAQDPTIIEELENPTAEMKKIVLESNPFLLGKIKNQKIEDARYAYSLTTETFRYILPEYRNTTTLERYLNDPKNNGKTLSWINKGSFLSFKFTDDEIKQLINHKDEFVLLTINSLVESGDLTLNEELTALLEETLTTMISDEDVLTEQTEDEIIEATFAEFNDELIPTETVLESVDTEVQNLENREEEN